MKLSLRRTKNVCHHIYKNNGGNFWVHYTIHTDDYKKLRVRRSLGTSSLPEAKRKRDQILEQVGRDGFNQDVAVAV